MDSGIYCRWVVASGVVAISWGGNEGGFVYGLVCIAFVCNMARQFQPANATPDARACMGALWAC